VKKTTMLFRSACALRMLPLLLLLAVTTGVQAQFNYTTNNGTITITGYTGPGGAVEIPSTTNGLAVTSIGDYSLAYCSSLTNITIPNSVTSIGADAFLAALAWPTSPFPIASSASKATRSLTAAWPASRSPKASPASETRRSTLAPTLPESRFPTASPVLGSMPSDFAGS
jgi:BspA type Leucine rich repeat region (6 copies)